MRRKTIEAQTINFTGNNQSRNPCTKGSRFFFLNITLLTKWVNDNLQSHITNNTLKAATL